ncbi:hypothetical protein M404DRAFT_25359 [Pisolithus tinctorius Marx 270]|uniref:Uncharacterized protein n=1 Tax=Pisolithus tinctorius Marx 270 TaxID=870435 RepID=A0A0C3PC93_PISTI|nr:hypothetical protein M404DRAFT_25359 [Pisolithus tinctorius Marx 270]
MSANHLSWLSQLICATYPDPIKVEKVSLRELFLAASAALVAEAKCMPDDREDLWDKKVMWLWQWEEKTGVIFPIVECSKVLGMDMKIDATNGPAVVEADEAYERWVVEEIAVAAWGRVNEDMWMGEEAAQDISEQCASAEILAVSAKMLHVKVSHPVWKMVMESEDNVEKPKVSIPPGLILHKEPCT